VLLALPASSLLLTRELLYTAVTRARRQAALWANSGSILSACARQNLRYSGLAARLDGS
jgi:exodeoxyribonuclease V alpha subunit